MRTAYLPLGSATRTDAVSEKGGPAGSDPALVRKQLFVEEGADFGLITPLHGYGPDPDFNAAISRGLNAWQAATWLDTPPLRLFGSICVSFDDIAGAVREIEEWAGHPGFKQVLVTQDGDRPFGHPQFESLWATAARHGLPVAVHFNDSGRQSLGSTPVGHFGTQVEYHALSHPLEYAAHLVSWICAGTFVRNPDLRVVFLEGGFLWYRPVVTRLAHRWREKSADLADATKDPLTCVRDHVRFASQPLESADPEEDVAGLLIEADGAEVLVFSSDYPHFDYDHPKRVLPQGIDDATRRRIMCDNARELYGLPSTRPGDEYDALR
jgi:predicted TIM-barrel fold metal-dependent hydrolase